jgi:VanZ family protein
VTADPAGTAFYLDGNLLLRRPGFVLSASRLKGHLILGDAAEGGHAWAGQLFGLAWFHRALDAAEIARHQALWTNHQANQLATATGLSALYLFDEGSGQWVLDRSPKGRRLWIPERYRVLEKTVLAPPWGSTPLQWSDVDDILINILGFVPFGFMVYSHRRLTRPNSRTWNVLWAVAAGTAISLAIELIQVWLPNRSSSATDLASDTLGTLIGVLIARRMFARPPVA